MNETAQQPEIATGSPNGEPVATVKQPRKIAILGTSQTSVHDAPYDDASWKIWNMSANWQYRKRLDLFFEIHPPEVLKAANCPQQYMEYLKSISKTLVVGTPSDEWPEAQLYPIHQIMAKYGDYFTCTFAYMMAMAIHLHEEALLDDGLGIGEIGLWGVDMAVGEEYSHQKPCAEYWIGLARGKGIKVTIAPQSPICRSNAMYGFDNPKMAREFTERLFEIRKNIKEHEVTAKVVNDSLLELRAAERILNELCHKWQL